MADTPSRMLRLLSLLQNSRDWPGTTLAERLAVSTRTLRRDVERLRELGYPVRALPGVGGGYRLEAGTAMPPLLLDDDEAVAIAVGLRTAAGGSVADVEETSLRALAKLEQVLPARLRDRITTLNAFTDHMPVVGPVADPAALTTTAFACRDRMMLRFLYTARGHDPVDRDVEPYRLVHVSSKWYLLCWDLLREDWRTFRVDRMSDPRQTGRRFAPRPLPAEDAAAYVRQSILSALAKYHAVVVLHAPMHVVAERFRVRDGILEEIDDHSCRLRTAADSLQWLALTIGMFDVEFEVEQPPELVDYIRRLSARLARAVSPTSASDVVDGQSAGQDGQRCSTARSTRPSSDR